MSRFRTLPQSFKFAFSGIKKAIKSEPNFRIHLSFALAALFLAFFLGCTTYEWLLLLFTISFVLILELFNTSMESIVNLVSPDIRPQAKIAKDVSAAAVLLGALTSIVVGAALFLPKILAL